LRKEAFRNTGLARALSKSGHCSRSQAKRLIATGRVRVNGRAVVNAEEPVAIGKDVIEVDGREIRAAERVYLMLNKPRGIITTADDEKGRATVYSLLRADMPWVAPVGRLDKASEGLLLLTNDSEWGARIASPQSHVSKTYHVHIAAVADSELLRRMTIGLRDESGDLLRARKASVVRSGAKNSWLETVLDEGKNRQIRRLMDGMGIKVLRLIRIAVGPLQLGSLPKGKVRELTAEEVDALRNGRGRGRAGHNHYANDLKSPA
jgi:23S rRNA pseudouridine2605 synthase